MCCRGFLQLIIKYAFFDFGLTHLVECTVEVMQLLIVNNSDVAEYTEGERGPLFLVTFLKFDQGMSKNFQLSRKFQLFCLLLVLFTSASNSNLRTWVVKNADFLVNFPGKSVLFEPLYWTFFFSFLIS